MIEKDIIDAGFERIDIPAESTGDKAFYYYTYDFTSSFGLITPASDEVEDEWFVEVFEVPEIKIKDRVDLFDFIETINKHL